MLDALRQYIHRPLRDGDRPRLFVSAIAVIAGVVAVFSLLGGPGSAPRHPATPTPSAAAPATSTAPRATATPEGPPSEEGPAGATAASRAEVRAARRAARRFLTGYLAFAYGRGCARSIRRASAALKRDLARHAPRVPRDVRTRRPRVRLLQSNGVSGRAASFTALVDDGPARYTVALELGRPTDGRWTVTAAES